MTTLMIAYEHCQLGISNTFPLLPSQLICSGALQ